MGFRREAESIAAWVSLQFIRFNSPLGKNPKPKNPARFEDYGYGVKPK
jgi:hypothetical protein